MSLYLVILHQCLQLVKVDKIVSIAIVHTGEAKIIVTFEDGYLDAVNFKNVCHKPF